MTATSQPPAASAAPHPLLIALAGLISLGVAMGIGRFAFTPILPVMLAEGAVDLAGASLLASANYLGYLAGALACTFHPWLWRRLGREPVVNAPALVRIGLVATALLTAAMALGVPAAWALLRFAAGVASAVAFLYTSSWCLEQLARRGQPSLGALIYVGPGAGIVVSGLASSALVAAHAPAGWSWLALAGLAALLTALAWSSFDAKHAVPGPGPGVSQGGRPAGDAPLTAQAALLGFAYGLAGIGYIVTATFLPVIARQALPGSAWLDLFWPLVGVGVMIGAGAASRLRSGGDLRLRLAVCYALQAAGVAASVVSPTLPGFAIGSLLLGLPFTTITFFAMQEARRIRPLQPTTFMGVLTALYGVGQIAGPPIAALLVARSATAAAGFTLALWLATAALVLGALVFLLLWKLYPLAGAKAGAAVSGSQSPHTTVQPGSGPDRG